MSVVLMMSVYTVLKMYNILLQFAILFSVIDLSLSYNLNTLHAIIYADAQNATMSLYGYTTALYRDKDKPRIFIGAPNGGNYGVSAKKSGVVFSCDIKQPCAFLSLDQDNQVNSWIGGTLDIHPNTNTIVICGHRYAMQIGIPGVCYFSNLEGKSRIIRKLLPLADPYKATRVFKVDGGNSKWLYNYQYGEAGLSAHFTNDKQNPSLILGAPGLLNWYGGSVLYSNLKLPSQPQYKVSYQLFDGYALFGYAVSSGRYTNQTVYASSSPKNKDYCGAVVLFQFGQHNGSVIDNRGMLHGSQIGESFGAALASGDINRDGYDDLVIGAPCYTQTNFNDGRIHIYYGGENFPLETSATHITGSNDGGQFGIAVTFLGDLNLDGYGDIAVGEPFSNDRKGNVFIYHGGPNGLSETPAQILQAEHIDSQLRGFGISVSKGVDIDGNGYPDISVGAHISGHAVILRSNPIVEITSQLTIVNGTKINVNGNTTLMLCYVHSGNPYTPKHIFMRRKFVIDPNYQRVTLAPPNVDVREFVLKDDCELVVLTTREKLNYLTDPVRFSVSYELVEGNKTKSNYNVGGNNKDTFCKTCPILRNVQPFETEFSFALKCGDDDVCISNLSYDFKFPDLENNTFNIGSADVIRMEILISNSGDSAYLTQLTITLPKHVQFNNIPNKCEEDEEDTLVCLVGNPLERHKQAFLFVHLNMKDVQTNYETSLNFSANISTSSNNKNLAVNKNYTIHLKKVVDLQLIGRTETAPLFYTNNATFKQVYQIHKKGSTPAEEVTVTINLPTHIQKRNVSYPIVKLYSIQGSIQGRDIFCKNNTHVDYIGVTNEIMSQLNSDSKDIVAKTREKKSLDSDIVYTNNLNKSIEIKESKTNDTLIPSFLSDKTFRLDCGDEFSNVLCTKFTCDIGTIKMENDIAIVRINALLDVDVLKKHSEFENSIVLFSYGHIDAAFDIDPISNNNANITSTFLDSTEGRIDMRILLGAILTGLLLLVVLTIILYKYGFFTRSKKLQLEKQKKEVATEEFANAQLSGEPCMDEE